MSNQIAAGTVRGAIGSREIEQMESVMTAVPQSTSLLPPPALPALDQKKGERCFRSHQGLNLLVKEIKDKEVDGEIIRGSRKFATFKKLPLGQCYELVTSDPEVITRLDALIEERGGAYLWDAETQVESYQDTRAEQLEAELKDNPELLERVSAIAAARGSFSLEPAEKPRQRKPKADGKTAPEPDADDKGDGFKLEQN